MKKNLITQIVQLLIIITIVAFSISCKKENSVDSGDSYESIKIGNQVWMKRNLDVSFYRNGDPIPQVTDLSTWGNLTTGAWTYYNNDPAIGEKYGKLYNWYAVNDPRGLAPIGWHISTDNDWWNLITPLGGISEAGGKLKTTGTNDWKSPNSGATNSSGFSGLPGGYAGGTAYYYVGSYGIWWTNKEVSAAQGLGWTLHFDKSDVNSGSDSKGNFFSVRCVKD